MLISSCVVMIFNVAQRQKQLILTIDIALKIWLLFGTCRLIPLQEARADDLATLISDLRHVIASTEDGISNAFCFNQRSKTLA